MVERPRCLLLALVLAGSMGGAGAQGGAAGAAPASGARLARAAPTAVPAAADPALEARMLAITSELRCLVCQNQTIAESHADLANDLRDEVRELLRQGRDEAQIKRYMTDRYGDFVLYRPPLKPTTWALWLGPAALLAIGVAALVRTIRRRARLGDDHFEPDPDEDDDAGPAAPEPIARPGASA